VDQDAILAQLDRVRAQPDDFLSDVVLGNLARDGYLRERGVTLLGGAVDESPQAYKLIESIIAAQDNLVEVLGRFLPKIVWMADEAGNV